MLFRYCTLHDIMKLKPLWAGLYASFKNTYVYFVSLKHRPMMELSNTKYVHFSYKTHIFASHCSHRQSFTSAPVHLQWMDDLVAHSLRPSDTIWQQILVNTGPGYGLRPDGIKPWPESMLTWQHWLASQTRFIHKAPNILAKISIEKQFSLRNVDISHGGMSYLNGA